ncbi:glycosyltransferase family 4 protein [Limobrevibacterium gyesilva]|uniref:Glycosyltransferase family 4 protein n=1 Tax=Limobrevibacterium gyesilva TaxID=2991712 RepID=A0AA42CF85_9PROT|nr:glycosyltransferase family 4 protein [Limobrevibacterium gyesilva]MCW3476928.1 glycosyltransferase family 4 protein [Limobrevibacterium gyesilva]
MTTSGPSLRRLRVVVLPNLPWQPYMESFRPDEAPDPGRLHRLLAERGIDFVVVDPLPSPYNPWGRAHPFFAGLDPLRALIVLLRHRSADLVISVFESGAVVLLLLRRLFFFRPPVALWDVSEDSLWRPRRFALNLVLPRIDKLLALTRQQKTATQRRYRLRAPADVIGYAIDEDFYHPAFCRGADYVLSVGEDVARDYPTLVAALRGLPAPAVLKTRRAVALPPDMVATVEIIRERLSFPKLRDLYASASVVVVPLCPSDHPGGITSLFEAMAMGKPVVASDVPMTREFIVPGETGLLVPVGDADAMRDAIAGLLARPDEQRRIGANARRHLETHLSMTAFADRYAACIRALACPERPGIRVTADAR